MADEKLPAIVSRDQALALGLKRYFTGKPCSKGHFSERFCSTYSCISCAEANTARYISENPEKYREKSRKWAANNKDKLAAIYKRYRAENLEKCKETSRRTALRHYYRNKEACLEKVKTWQANNKKKCATYAKRSRVKNADWWKEYVTKNRHKRRKYAREWVKRNRAYAASQCANYRAMKRQAMPVWSDVKAIREIYREARRISVETGIMHHVDHIYPLVSDLVCGLHVPENLQIITASENIAKSNKVLG